MSPRLINDHIAKDSMLSQASLLRVCDTHDDRVVFDEFC